MPSSEPHDDGIIIAVRFPILPVPRGMENLHGTDFLPGRRPPDRNLAHLKLTDPLSISRDHRIPPEPEIVKEVSEIGIVKKLTEACPARNPPAVHRL